jgi:ABC-type branched-subunit amino acid transport system ATPase component
MIEIEDLTVRFGGVTSLSEVSVRLDRPRCGLIGPNGAGKTTFFNVLSGFVTPSSGRIVAFGTDLSAMSHFRRARWGLRRTFQTEQAIETLSVFDNVAMVWEHTTRGGNRRRRADRRRDVLGAIDFVSIRPDPSTKVGTLGAHDRRLVELARAVVGAPRLILLDEPAAGLPDAETEQMGQVIRAIPDAIGATVILADHDMNLVSGVCEETMVLDFGQVVTSGPTAEVLRDERVVAAYLGGEAVVP